MPFEAYLTDADGAPLTGDVPIELRFFPSSAPGELPADCRTFIATPDDGWLRVDLDLCADFDPSPDCGTVELERLIVSAAMSGDTMAIGLFLPEVGPDGTELLPRFPLGAVPHASTANLALDSDRLDGWDASDFWRRDEAVDATTVGGFTPDELRGSGSASGLDTTRSRVFRFYEVPRSGSGIDVLNLQRNILETGVILSATVTTTIDHADPTELAVRLVSPAGTELTLHDRGPGAAGGIDCVFPDTCICPAGPCVDALEGESLSGTWTLIVQDLVAGNAATVEAFELAFTYEDPDTIADVPSTFTVGERTLAVDPLGGSGALGDRVVVSGETLELSPYEVHDFASLIVLAGGRVAPSGAGALYIRTVGDLFVAGRIDVDGAGEAGGDGAEDIRMGGAGGDGGYGAGSLYLEVGGEFRVTPAGVVSASGTPGANGDDGRQGSLSRDYDGNPGIAGVGAEFLGLISLAGGDGGEGGRYRVPAAGGEGGRSSVSVPANTPSAMLLSPANSFRLPNMLLGSGGGGGGSGFSNDLSGTPGGTGSGGGGGGGGGAGTIIVRAPVRTVDGIVVASGGAGGVGGREALTITNTTDGASGATGQDGVVVFID